MIFRKFFYLKDKSLKTILGRYVLYIFFNEGPTMSWALYVYFLFSHHNNSKSLLNILYNIVFMRKTRLQGLNNSLKNRTPKQPFLQSSVFPRP